MEIIAVKIKSGMRQVVRKFPNAFVSSYVGVKSIFVPFKVASKIAFNRLAGKYLVPNPHLIDESIFASPQSSGRPGLCSSTALVNRNRLVTGLQGKSTHCRRCCTGSGCGGNDFIGIGHVIVVNETTVDVYFRYRVVNQYCWEMHEIIIKICSGDE